MSGDLIEWMMARVEKRDDGCWVWQGAHDQGGYGKIARQRVDGRGKLAHRIMYQLLVGPLDGPDVQLDHLCRVRDCVNPEHLEPVDSFTNTMRGESFSAVNARKTHCRNGHLLDEANTFVYASKTHKRRCCRACGRERQRRYEQRLRDVLPSDGSAPDEAISPATDDAGATRRTGVPVAGESLGGVA